MKRILQSSSIMKIITNILCTLGVVLCIALLVLSNKHIQNSVNRSFTNTIVVVDNKYIDPLDTTHLVLRDTNSGTVLDIKNSDKYNSYEIGDKVHMDTRREVKEDGTEEIVYFFPKDYQDVDDDEER